MVLRENFNQPNDNYLGDTRVTEQLRELDRRLRTLSDAVDAASAQQDITETIAEVVPSMVNFADNTDFIFSDEAYNVGTGYTAYTDDEDVLANWYQRAQSETDAWEENSSGTEAPNDSIRSAAHGSGARTRVIWDTTEGSLKFSGGRRLGTRLYTKHANQGNYMAVRCQLSLVGAVPTSDIKLKASIWDNSDNRILRGTKPSLSLTKILHTGAGDETVTREFILEVQMPDGRRFYSDTVTPASIINTVSPISVSTTRAVTIEWDSIIGASRYRVYRRTPAATDTAWYLVGTITNGTTIVYDYGGSGGGTWVIPSFTPDDSEYQYAQAFYDNIGELLTTVDNIQEISLAIQIPTGFAANGNQFLQLEFVKSDYTNTTTAEVDSESIRGDRIGLSYTNGRWAQSARDFQRTNVPITVTPPPTGGGNPDNPPAGGGIIGCVEEHTPILIWNDSGNHYYIPANEVVIGDRLVSWDTKLEIFAPTKVNKIINGMSTVNHRLYADEYELPCSFSHRLITSFKDFEKGTRVKFVEKTLIYKKEKKGLVLVEIESKETIKLLWKVITFTLSKHRKNYIANGFLCHNEKPMFGEG